MVFILSQPVRDDVIVSLGVGVVGIGSSSLLVLMTLLGVTILYLLLVPKFIIETTGVHVSCNEGFNVFLYSENFFFIPHITPSMLLCTVIVTCPSPIPGSPVSESSFTPVCGSFLSPLPLRVLCLHAFAVWLSEVISLPGL